MSLAAPPPLQTVRRPPIYYSHLMDVERTPVSALGDAERGVLEMNSLFQAACLALPGAQAGPALSDGPSGGPSGSGAGGPASPSAPAAAGVEPGGWCPEGGGARRGGDSTSSACSL
jgi:hypothetical protein